MRYIIILFVFFYVPCHASEVIDSMWLELTYHVKQKDTEDRKVHKELEIGTRVSSFYSKEYRRSIELDDSLTAEHVKFDVYMQVMSANNAIVRIMTYGVYKNYPYNGKLLYTNEIFKYKYCYTEDVPEIEWQLIEGDTLICGYPCKHATGTLRGRQWEVWYAMDIPIADGPWKLGGLPGIIMYARESKGDFLFECIGMEKKNGPILFFGKDSVKCTPLQFQKELEEYWYDQNGYVSHHEGMPKADVSGLAVKPIPRKPCLMEYY